MLEIISMEIFYAAKKFLVLRSFLSSVAFEVNMDWL
jgi:hypothetical protein